MKLTTFLFILLSLVYNSLAENCQAIPGIDGITSASAKFHVNNGNTCETSASISWWDYYNNGNPDELRYGTSTSYGNTINLRPFTKQTNITTTIPNLKAGTKYYVQFYRQHNSTIRKTNLTFTTATPSVSSSSTSSSSISSSSISSSSVSSSSSINMNTGITVAFATPGDGDIVSTSFPIEVTASDNNGGTISKVELSLDGNFIRTESVTPYTWNDAAGKDPVLENLSFGSHSLKAVATDNDGNTLESIINVTVIGSNSSSSSLVSSSSISSSSLNSSSSTENNSSAVQTGIIRFNIDMEASGAGFRDTLDQFSLNAIKLSGDFDFLTYINPIQNSTVFSRAGIMLRDDTSSTSRFVALTNNITGDIQFSRRVIEMWNPVVTDQMGQPNSIWLRLIRQGSVIISKTSVDGVNWNTVDSTVVFLNDEVFAGVVLASGDASLASVSFVQASINQPITESDWTLYNIGQPLTQGQMTVGNFAEFKIQPLFISATLTENILEIQNALQGDKIQLLNMLGVQIFSETVSQNGTYSKIFSNLNSGHYILSIQRSFLHQNQRMTLQ